MKVLMISQFTGTVLLLRLWYYITVSVNNKIITSVRLTLLSLILVLLF